MPRLLDEIIRAQKQGIARGIASICSAHPWVLKTALCGETPVLIEATCNQVNQSGGYTGMTPADFVSFVRGIAAENNLPANRLILGGDHLGPSPWQGEPMERAMLLATEMVQAYVQAGFTKIHLDASMRLGDDDPALPLDPELIAHRTALLAKAAEAVANPATAPRYVIGTEVPIPGGATTHEEAVHVTTVADARLTLEVTHAAFIKAGLETAWERVIALVVQPGVEFGDDFVLDYDPKAARDLAHFIETTSLVYEAHSTDYQRRDRLQALVGDHFAILKVGPALTNIFRETVYALTLMESELFPLEKRSQLIETLDTAMQRKPAHWKKHYRGSEREMAFARKYSLSDRARYYWSEPDVQTALGTLLNNLDAAPLPLTLIRQFLPDIIPSIRAGKVPGSTTGIIRFRIQRMLEDYSVACGDVIPADMG